MHTANTFNNIMQSFTMSSSSTNLPVIMTCNLCKTHVTNAKDCAHGTYCSHMYHSCCAKHNLCLDVSGIDGRCGKLYVSMHDELPIKCNYSFQCLVSCDCEFPKHLIGFIDRMAYSRPRLNLIEVLEQIKVDAHFTDEKKQMFMNYCSVLATSPTIGLNFGEILVYVWDWIMKSEDFVVIKKLFNTKLQIECTCCECTIIDIVTVCNVAHKHRNCD